MSGLLLWVGLTLILALPKINQSFDWVIVGSWLMVIGAAIMVFNAFSGKNKA